MILVSFTFVSAFSGSGSGTEGDPYQITNCTQLQEMLVGFTADWYLLMNDIDCSDTINWNGGAGFIPIPHYSGTFDGQGYSISDLYIVTAGRAGLFSQNDGGTIKNINLVNVDITGVSRVGGFVGLFNSGHLEGCSVTGSITGDDVVGGLVGEHIAGMSIVNCYSRATVIASSLFSYYIGGAVGLQGASSTSYCYSAGITYFSAECSNCGGFMGGGSGLITNNFYNSDNTEYPNGIGTGKTTEEMKNINTYLDDGWTITASSNNLNDGYPYLVGDEWFIYVYTDTTPPTFTTIPEDVVINYGELFEGVDFDAVDEDYVYFSVNDTENFQIDSNEGQLENITLLDVGFYPVNVTITDPSNNLDWTIWTLTVLPLEEPPVQGGGSGLAQTFTSTPTTQTTENAPLFSAIGLNLNISSWNLSEKIQSISISDKITEFFQKIKDWFNIQLNLNWRTQ